MPKPSKPPLPLAIEKDSLLETVLATMTDVPALLAIAHMLPNQSHGEVAAVTLNCIKRAITFAAKISHEVHREENTAKGFGEWLDQHVPVTGDALLFLLIIERSKQRSHLERTLLTNFANEKAAKARRAAYAGHSSPKKEALRLAFEAFCRENAAKHKPDGTPYYVSRAALVREVIEKDCFGLRDVGTIDKKIARLKLDVPHWRTASPRQ